MSHEKPPDPPEKVIKIADYKRRKKEREKKMGQTDLQASGSLTGEKFNRQKYFEHEINRIGKEKWIALMKFARRIEVVHPEKHDREVAEQIRNMTDEELLFHFKITNIEFWEQNPLTFKTLYEEIDKRMKGEK